MTQPDDSGSGKSKRSSNLTEQGSGPEDLAGLHNGDPFAPYRTRPRKSFWTMGLQPIEAGDILSPEHHSRVFEIFPEDGQTAHTIDARGRLCLLVSIPEEQLPPFGSGEWELSYLFDEDPNLLIALLNVGVRIAETAEGPGLDHALEVPFSFGLRNSQQLQEAIQLTELESVNFFGVTHMEEGLMLTIKGEVGLPEGFRNSLRAELLQRLQAIYSHGST